MKTEKSEAREGTEELRRRSSCQLVVTVGVEKVEASERARKGTSQVVRFFFPSFLFSLSPSSSDFFLLLLFLSPRAEPLSSLVRSSTHSRRHEPRVRSQERAARAGRDGDGSGSSSAGKRKQLFFLLHGIFSSLAASASRYASCGSGDSLWSLANEEETTVSLPPD